MSGYFWNYEARKPRHNVAQTCDVSVVIERLPGVTPASFECQLCDVSRTGAQTRGSVQMQSGETCDIHITSQDGKLDVVLPATVRWSRPGEEAGQFSTGYSFPVETAYETLGELFLHGVLAPENTAGS